MAKFLSCCIIDDDELFALSSKRILKETDFCESVLFYTEGQEALDGLIGLMIENIELPEIIFLDLNMPKTDGWAFLEEFEQLPAHKISHIQIYITSSFISPNLIEKAKKFKSVKDYIVKPLTEKAVTSIINSK